MTRVMKICKTQKEDNVCIKIGQKDSKVLQETAAAAAAEDGRGDDGNPSRHSDGDRSFH